jgi:hypothetical protein
MILNQLQIATEIVTITYAALIGGVFLAMALAFGLGGRDVARQMLEGAYVQGQENKDQFRRDLDRGMTKARSQVDERRADLDGEPDSRTTTTRMPRA